MSLQSVSPDRRWALVGVTPPGGHGDRNTMAVALPLEGGAPTTVCDDCNVGFGFVRFSAPLVSWSLDWNWVRAAAAVPGRLIKDSDGTCQVRGRASHLYEGLRQ